MLKLASSIGLALAVANLKRRIRILAVRSILAAIAAVVGVTALVFFLVAGHLALTQAVGAVASAAIIGAVLLVLALLLFFLASRPMREQSRAVEEPAAQFEHVIGDGLSRLRGAGAPLRSPMLFASILALAAGLFLGRRSKRD